MHTPHSTYALLQGVEPVLDNIASMYACYGRETHTIHATAKAPLCAAAKSSGKRRDALEYNDVQAVCAALNFSVGWCSLLQERETNQGGRLHCTLHYCLANKWISCF